MSRALGLPVVLSLVAGAVTVLTPATAQAATLQAELVATRWTDGWAVPSPDPAGIAWDPSTGRLIISDSEVDEMPLYAGVNLYTSTLSGEQVAGGGTTLPWSKEPTGVAYRPGTDTLFVSDDDQDRIFQVRRGADGRFGTGDDGALTSFSTAGIGNTDPEDVAVDMDVTTDGNLLVVDGKNKEVFEYSPGADRVFGTSDDAVVQFDVYRHGARDPEGIVHHPGRNTVLVLDGRTNKIYEVTRRGELLNVISIVAANPVKAAGIALAPASDGSGAQNLYIVDRGVDNNVDPGENDGRFYEMSVAFPPLGGGTDPGTDPVTGSGTLDVAVKRGSSDAEERPTGTVLSGNLQLVAFKGVDQVVGLRFEGLGIPRGATITKAYVQFQTDLASTGPASLTVAGQAADNPATFTSAIGNVSSRPRTSATVGWTPPDWPTVGARDAAQRTPDLAKVVQEIVSRPGWAGGNALALIITGTGSRTAESYNTGGLAAAPTLHVEWTA